jgi:carboxyl-terminal processing protease
MRPPYGVDVPIVRGRQQRFKVNSEMTQLPRKFAFALVLIVAPMLGSLSAPARAETQPSSVGLFDEAWRLTRDRYYDSSMSGLDWNAVGDKYRPQAAAASSSEQLSIVINAMLAELGASHTGYFTPADPAYFQLADIFGGAERREARPFFKGGEIRYPGIGIFTREIDGRVFVTGVMDGLPAAKADLRVGDEIVDADGHPFAPVESFAGKVGQQVALNIRRYRDSAPRPLPVTPQMIQPNDAFLNAMRDSARVIEAGGLKIGYLHVWSYAGREYQNLLEELISDGKLKDADALIWDLRDGWGGAQPEYLDIFASGPTMTMKDRNDTNPETVAAKWRRPAALLMNGGTRSGKEVLAYGFKKYGFGEVVGTRSAGALLAGRTFYLSDGSLLLLAVADVAVDGERLEGRGVAPTIEVPFDMRYAAGADPQLDRAVEVLTEKLSQ